MGRHESLQAFKDSIEAPITAMFESHQGHVDCGLSCEEAKDFKMMWNCDNNDLRTNHDNKCN